MPFDTQTLAARRIRRQRERDRSRPPTFAVRSRNVNLPAERSLSQRNWHSNLKAISHSPKIRMRADVDREQNITCRRTTNARNALAAQTDFLAIFNSGRNLDFDRFDVAVLPLHR